MVDRKWGVWLWYEVCKKRKKVTLVKNVFIQCKVVSNLNKKYPMLKNKNTHIYNLI